MTRQANATDRDTIAAIATPPGRGGIGILRLSGPGAVAIAEPLLRLRAPLEPFRVRLCAIVDPAAADPGKLDEAIVTYYAAPHSYTGENVLEIACHGSPVVLDFLLRETISRGARLADPGEFTERAFLAGRLDLMQAEAVRDLIDAQTLHQARVAAGQLDGALSRRVAPIKTALVHLIAQLEAGIDFAEDDTPTLSAEDILAQAAPIAAELATLAHSFAYGRLVHSGLTLAIVGEPNVGKSSLFNRLVERERAIVTAAPGTTRDLVTERVSIAGIPIELVDTAGLRRATPSGPLDEAERLGIEKSREALAVADVVLLVLDAPALLATTRARQAPQGPSLRQQCLDLQEQGSDSRPKPPDRAHAPHLSLDTLPPDNLPRFKLRAGYPEALIDSLKDRQAIVVLNKCDLLPADQAGHAELPPAGQLSPDSTSTRAVNSSSAADLPSPTSAQPFLLQQMVEQLSGALPQALVVATSAYTGAGLTDLRGAIERHLQTPHIANQGGMLTNLRQHQAVEAAQASIEAALAGARLPHEMLLLDLYTALRHLDALTGATTSDDILNLIFSTFCIGK